MAAPAFLLGLLILVSPQQPWRKGELRPTPDPKVPSEVYVPKSLEDAYEELDRMLNREAIAEIKGAEESMTDYHFGPGL